VCATVPCKRASCTFCTRARRRDRGRESSEPDVYMPRNQALVDLLLERRQDVYCLQVLF